MASEGNRFAKLLEGDEVERFLSSFVLPEDVRKDAQKRSPSVQFPENTNDVLRDVKSIWQEKGFLSPAELRTELIGKYTPNSDAAFKNFITDIELSRNTPETVTGYLSKEHAYVATGLGHLYAEETGKPIAMAEVDFSNMGGTNKEFERRIAAEKGISVGEVNPKEAERMTDQAVKLLSDSMTSSLGSELPAGAKIVPIRTGGDELRLIFTGIDDPAQLAKITDKMHAHIEHHVASMGLQDHPHLKDPTNPVRNGFGAAIAIQDMRQINNPSTLVQDLDERIKAEKEKIGNLRLGQIDNVAMTQQIETSLQKGQMSVPVGVEKADYVSSVLDAQSKKAKAFSEELHSRNPVHNPELIGGVSGFKAYIEAATPAMAASPLVSRPVPQVIANDNYAGENRPSQLAPMASLDDRRTAIAKSNFESANVQLSPTDSHFLKQSIKNLTPMDPSAQVMMPKDMVALIEVYGAEADEFRTKFDPADPEAISGLKKAGLSSVAEISPRAMAVSFHNLAGLNNTLGHHNADLVLRHMGAGIIEGALDKAGIHNSTGGEKPYSIAHHGGGNFSVLLQPVAEDAAGNKKFISQNTVAEIETEIGRRVTDLNSQPVDKFLEQKGVPVDDDMRKSLAKGGISTFADIQDPKDRVLSTNENIKGRVNGIHAAVASEAISSGVNELKGDAIIARVRTQADVNLTALRDDKILSQDITKKASLDQARSLLIEARDAPKIDVSWNARVADMLQGWRDNPASTPPLKEIVAVAAEVHGVKGADKDSMEFKRLQKVAEIVDIPQSPEYHSQHHTRDVAFLTSALALRDARTEPMGQKLFLNTVTAAAMHDFDHDGKGNGHGENYEPFRLEHQSVDNVGKLLPEDMRDASFRQMREAVSFTDFSKAEMKPELESPAALLRKIVTQDAPTRQESIQKTNVVVDKINPNFDVNTFAASDTARMAKLVAEGDLMPSAGLTPEYTLKMTELLSKENPVIKAGPQSANGFLKFGCANMFVSEAAKEMIVPAYERNMVVTADMAAIEAKRAEPAKQQTAHTATSPEKRADLDVKDSGAKATKPAVDADGPDAARKGNVKVGALDGVAATSEGATSTKKQTPAHSNSTIHEGRSHVGGAGVGVGMGIYGLTQKLGETGSAAGDLKNSDTKNLAKAGIVADTTAVVVDSADGLAALQKVSKGLQTASKVSRVAAPVGVALSVASGAIDYKIAVKQHDGARAADAIGGTTGGVAGAAVGGVAGAKAGALAGAAVGTFFGGIGAVPGAAIGGFIGGVVGAVGGAFAGAEAGKKIAEVTIKDSLQKKFDEERRNSQPQVAAPTASAALRAEPKVEPKAEPRIQPKIEQKTDEPDRFAKSAPDLGKAFKASADPHSAPDLAANDPKFKVVANNKVHMAHGI